MQNDGKIHITGHACYAPRGSDIICSAISALLQTFVASVDKLTSDNIKSDIRRGEAVIVYEDLSENAQLLMDSFFIGVSEIESAYPGYVKIEKTKL